MKPASMRGDGYDEHKHRCPSCSEVHACISGECAFIERKTRMGMPDLCAACEPLAHEHVCPDCGGCWWCVAPCIDPFEEPVTLAVNIQTVSYRSCSMGCDPEALARMKRDRETWWKENARKEEGAS